MTPTTPSPRSSGPARLVVLGIMVFWLLLPVLQWGTGSQDAVPFLVAGQFAADGDHGAIYSSERYVMSAEFRAASCERLGPEYDCSTVPTPFISLPTAFLPGVALSPLPDDVGVAAIRLIAAAAAAGGLWVLWRRLGADDPTADTTMAITGVLLTPYVYYVVAIGQNTPLLFLSACLGLAARPTLRGDIGRSALWACTIATKAFPAALGLIVLAARRWRFLAATAAWSVALLGLALAITDPSLLTEFPKAASVFSDDTLRIPANASAVALAHQHADDLPLELPILAGTVVLVGALWWWRLRHAALDVQWAWGWVAVLALTPTAWWHYTVLAVAAVALAVAALAPKDRPRWAIPAVAAATGFLSLPIDYGLTTQAVQVVLVLATLVGVALLCPTGPAAAAYPSTPTSPTTNVPSS